MDLEYACAAVEAPQPSRTSVVLLQYIVVVFVLFLLFSLFYFVCNFFYLEWIILCYLLNPPLYDPGNVLSPLSPSPSPGGDGGDSCLTSLCAMRRCNL